MGDTSALRPHPFRCEASKPPETNVLSGSTDAGMAEKVKTLGADEFLQKPVDQVALFTALDKVLPRR